MALHIMLKVVTNILSNPADPKYRTLKVENSALKAKVFACPGGRELLLAAGWRTEGVGKLGRSERLVLPEDANMTELAQARDALEMFLANRLNTSG